MSCARSHVISQDKTSHMRNWMEQGMQTGLCQEAGALRLVSNLITCDSVPESQRDGEVEGRARPETEKLYVSGELQLLSKTHTAYPSPYTDRPSPRHGLRDERK